jgi:hypothetical protein
MTVATVIYYSGYHPYTLEKAYTARTKNEKLNQRMFFFWYKGEFRRKIERSLSSMGRSDLLKKLFSDKKERNQSMVPNQARKHKHKRAR